MGPEPPGALAGRRARRPAGPAVVVTGIGTVSALAVGGGAALRAALDAGATGIGPVRAFPTAGGPNRLGGEVGDLAPHLADDEVRRLPRVSQLAVVAARLALSDAGLEPGQLGAGGLVLGSHWGDFRSSETFARGFLLRGPLGLSPLVFPSTVMNAMAAHVALAVGVRGPMLTVNDHGAAGDLAVAQGAALLGVGRAAVVLAGGVDELSPILYRELARLGGVSTAAPGPEGCWPFDRRANGTVLGEGATLLVLETREAARARGARVYAEVGGAAWGNVPARPEWGGRGRVPEPHVVRRALEAAGLARRDVDAVYLTGPGEPRQDAAELELVARALGAGEPRPRLTALTPLVGDHAGLGGLRSAAAALAVGGARVPPLPALRAPIRADLALVAASPGSAGPPAAPVRVALVHAYGRGGTHVAIVLRSPAALAEAAA
jgi:3-oxoacyl-(acyl-carrier-protein) synthase